MQKPIIGEKSYPALEELTYSKSQAYLILPLYAGYHGEFSSLLQYVCYYLRFCELGDLDTANVILKIILSELEHLALINKVLRKLGCEEKHLSILPLTEGAYNKRLKYSRTFRAMFLDSIAGELSSISEYNKIKNRLKDSTLKEIIEGIIADERAHALVLEEKLKEWYKLGK